MKTRDEIQAEALAAIGDKQNAGIEVSMGVGKTFLGLKHMLKNYTDICMFLVVGAKRTHFDAWKDECKKRNCEELLDHITFSTYRSLNKQSLNYDVIYLDECHNLKESHRDYLLKASMRRSKIIGLTGTYPNKANSEKGIMCNTFCPKVFSYDTDDAIADGILNNYNIYVHMLKLSDKKDIPKKTRDGKIFYTSEINDYTYWSDQIVVANTKKREQIARIKRMHVLKMFKTKEKYAQKLFNKQENKTLIFANTIDQADRFCKHTHHSRNKKSKENLEAFKNGTINKLAAVEQLSESVNIPNLRCGIIMHAYGNNRKASQKIGRLLRLNPDETADIHILCYINTVDDEWVEKALVKFNEDKIWMIKNG